MNASEVADVLDKAADLIWLRGRCIGEREADDGALCVRGGIEAAGCEYRDRVETERVLGRYLLAHPDVLRRGVQAHLPFVREHGFFPPWVWNDDLPLSPENDALVVDVLKRAAKRIREVAS